MGKSPSTGTKRSVKRVAHSAITENAPPALPPRPVRATAFRSRALGGNQPIRATLTKDTALTITFRSIRPSWRNYIEYVGIAAKNGDTEMTKYLATYNALPPKDRIAHCPEQLCDLTSIAPGALVGAVMRALWESKAAEASMLSAMAQPDVMARLAKAAMRPDGHQDRELFLSATGALPHRKGVSLAPININIGTQPTGLVEPGGPGLLDMDEETVEMSRRQPIPVTLATPTEEDDGPDGPDEPDGDD